MAPLLNKTAAPTRLGGKQAIVAGMTASVPSARNLVVPQAQAPKQMEAGFTVSNYPVIRF